MRDIASCFGEYAIQISDASCSSYSSQSSLPANLIPSIQDSVSCLYRITLSTQKQLLITATWTKNSLAQSQGLSISFGDNPSTSFKLNTNSRLFRKKKGSKSFESDGWEFDVFWDLSSAKYELGPEPVSGYYILVTVDSELGLILGDMAEEAASRKVKIGIPLAKCLLISRREHFSGSNSLYLTKARFSENGDSHEVLIRFTGENEGRKNPMLSVSIDRKAVIRVKRLQWNFRGNQSVFVDGLLVDLMWDVHGWFFDPENGYGTFMFRTRSGLDSRLWLEEKLVDRGQEKVEFSLLIYACKGP